MTFADAQLVRKTRAAVPGTRRSWLHDFNAANLRLQFIDPKEHSQWDDILQRHGDTGIFHSSVWARVLSMTYGYKPIYVTLWEGHQLRFLLPMMDVRPFGAARRGISLPFSDYCQAFVDTDIAELPLFTILSELGRERGWRYIELRGDEIPQPNTMPSTVFSTHTLELTRPLAKLREGFRQNMKRNIRIAEKGKVSIVRSNSMEAMGSYYQLHCLTRKRLGLPPQPRRFFDNVFREIVLQNLGDIFLAYVNGQPIAGAIFFFFDKEVIYKFSGGDVMQRALCPNHLLIWQAIQYYQNIGMERLCFGRTDISDQGLIHFKRGWGTEEKLINYYRYDLVERRFIRQKKLASPVVRDVMRKLPTTALRAIGELTYKYIG